MTSQRHVESPVGGENGTDNKLEEDKGRGVRHCDKADGASHEESQRTGWAERTRHEEIDNKQSHRGDRDCGSGAGDRRRSIQHTHTEHRMDDTVQGDRQRSVQLTERAERTNNERTEDRQRTIRQLDRDDRNQHNEMENRRRSMHHAERDYGCHNTESEERQRYTQPTYGKARDSYIDKDSYSEVDYRRRSSPYNYTQSKNEDKERDYRRRSMQHTSVEIKNKDKEREDRRRSGPTNHGGYGNDGSERSDRRRTTQHTRTKIETNAKEQGDRRMARQSADTGDRNRTQETARSNRHIQSPHSADSDRNEQSRRCVQSAGDAMKDTNEKRKTCTEPRSDVDKGGNEQGKIHTESRSGAKRDRNEVAHRTGRAFDDVCGDTHMPGLTDSNVTDRRPQKRRHSAALDGVAEQYVYSSAPVKRARRGSEARQYTQSRMPPQRDPTIDTSQPRDKLGTSPTHTHARNQTPSDTHTAQRTVPNSGTNRGSHTGDSGFRRPRSDVGGSTDTSGIDMGSDSAGRHKIGSSDVGSNSHAESGRASARRAASECGRGFHGNGASGNGQTPAASKRLRYSLDGKHHRESMGKLLQSANIQDNHSPPSSTPRSTPRDTAPEAKRLFADDLDTPAGSEQWTNNQEQVELDPRLDVCSEQFDPAMALAAPTIPLPFPKMKAFDNLSKLAGFLFGAPKSGSTANTPKPKIGSAPNSVASTPKTREARTHSTGLTLSNTANTSTGPDSSEADNNTTILGSNTAFSGGKTPTNLSISSQIGSTSSPKFISETKTAEDTTSSKSAELPAVVKRIGAGGAASKHTQHAHKSKHAHSAKERMPQKKRLRDVLQRMPAFGEEGGPLSVLYTCFSQKCRTRDRYLYVTSC
ncbi:hypothetical protein SARC_03460 [Sphaeroforma arctica JP610]|uniref:Uncharacterized protein n=1 Tax=Sphaeroforma arctica JP610 TaxID=667725 RepID=A0A0L0G5R8_9EUKA|nr:hypothetical protein SARC_03460 [Sphaeroforma arctica JP610]KNC84299.1 hypothetical protein SARC_03460 [Sphaeroforma arctica JP610]|eukprot:XP_014158201.1 hypothetical protein SARC_03460 [Sphaeroforma arctica JP610]